MENANKLTLHADYIRQLQESALAAMMAINLAVALKHVKLISQIQYQIPIVLSGKLENAQGVHMGHILGSITYV